MQWVNTALINTLSLAWRHNKWFSQMFEALIIISTSKFHSIRDVCKPVLKKYMKGPKVPAENRKKRQSDASADVESCLVKIKVGTTNGLWQLTVEGLCIKVYLLFSQAETAFAEIVATCSADGEVSPVISESIIM